jgi:hypothetical protein
MDRIAYWGLLPLVRAKMLRRRFRRLTMVPKKRFYDNILLAKYCVRHNDLSSGCYVECGTWAGGMSFAMMQACPEIADWYFFDSYEGLPPAQPIDGQRAIERQKAGKMQHNNNTADYQSFMENLEKARLANQTAEVHKGWFENTLPEFVPARPISILRLDGDWYDSTMTCLDHLFDHVADGGLIIIDDYYDWEGCSRAVHDFFSKRSSPQRMRQSANGVSFIVKQHEETPG